MYELKMGNGGHGPEPFNTETGEYEKIEFDLEGENVGSWEDLLNLSFSDPSDKAFFERLPDTNQEKIEYIDGIKQLYTELLQEEVDKRNADGYRSELQFEKFDSVDECIKGVEKVYTKKFLNDILESEYGEIYANKDETYKVEDFAHRLQKNRYPSVKMKLVSKEDFDEKVGALDRMSQSALEGAFDTGYVFGNQYIPIYRGLYDIEDIQNTVDGFTRNGEDYSVSLLGRSTGNCGNAIYMSYSKDLSIEYAKEFGSGGVLVSGYVEPSKMKILVRSETSKYPSWTAWSGTPVLDELFSKRELFLNGVKKQAEKCGYKKQEVDKIISRFNSLVFGNGDREDANSGSMAMILGYDAMGTNHNREFCILNAGMVNLSDESYFF